MRRCPAGELFSFRPTCVARHPLVAWLMPATSWLSTFGQCSGYWGMALTDLNATYTSMQCITHASWVAFPGCALCQDPATERRVSTPTMGIAPSSSKPLAA